MAPIVARKNIFQIFIFDIRDRRISRPWFSLKICRHSSDKLAVLLSAIAAFFLVFSLFASSTSLIKAGINVTGSWELTGSGSWTSWIEFEIIKAAFPLTSSIGWENKFEIFDKFGSAFIIRFLDSGAFSEIAARQRDETRRISSLLL